MSESLCKALWDSRRGGTQSCEKKLGIEVQLYSTLCKLWWVLPEICDYLVFSQKTDPKMQMQRWTSKIILYLLWMNVSKGEGHYFNWWDPTFLCPCPPRLQKRKMGTAFLLGFTISRYGFAHAMSSQYCTPATSKLCYLHIFIFTTSHHNIYMWRIGY